MSFDPATFMNTTYDEANDTKVTPCPVGEYTAVATKVETKTWASRDGSSSGVKLEILWEIDDANVKQLVGRDKVTSRQNIMLDLNEAGTGLDLGKGKNVGLGRLREALGLNTPGESFSFAMIEGRIAKVSVSHRINGEDIYDEIKKVAAAG